MQRVCRSQGTLRASGQALAKGCNRRFQARDSCGLAGADWVRQEAREAQHCVCDTAHEPLHRKRAGRDDGEATDNIGSLAQDFHVEVSCFEPGQ
jgi:hypothetical protein